MKLTPKVLIDSAKKAKDVAESAKVIVELMQNNPGWTDEKFLLSEELYQEFPEVFKNFKPGEYVYGGVFLNAAALIHARRI